MGRYIQKPKLGETIIPGHPLSQGLNLCLVFNEGSGREPIDHGKHHLRPTNEFQNSDFVYKNDSLKQIDPSPTAYATYEDDKVTTLQGTTIVLWKERYQLYTGGGTCGVYAVATANRCTVWAPSRSAGVDRVIWDFGGNVVGTTRVFVSPAVIGDDIFVCTTGTRGMEIWQNGNLIGSNSSNPSRGRDARNEFMIGKSYYLGYGNYCYWKCLYVYDRQLSIGAVKVLSKNPFVIFPSHQEPITIGDVGTVPSAPSNVVCTPGELKNTITWDAVAGAASYNIYWSTSSGVTKITGTKIAGVTSPHDHSGLDFGETTYYYVVTAENAIGESADSAEVFGVPLAPTVYGVVAISGIKEITVTWTGVTGADYYKIYWLNASGVTKIIGNVITNILDTSYTHTELNPNLTYYYVVTCVGGSLVYESANESIEVSATPRDITHYQTLFLSLLPRGKAWGN